jgi:site-specific DNA-cytosine methylase
VVSKMALTATLLNSYITEASAGRALSCVAAATAAVSSARAAEVAVHCALSCASLLSQPTSSSSCTPPTMTSDVTSDRAATSVQPDTDDPFGLPAELLLLDATSEKVYTGDDDEIDSSRERRRYRHITPLVIPAMDNVDLGKSTSGFAGSEPAVPFTGRPPDENRRPLNAPRSNTHLYEPITHTSTDSHYYRNLHMPSHDAEYSETTPFFSHYSGFAGIGTLALAWRHTGGFCVGGFEVDEDALSVFAAENPVAAVARDWYDIDVADLPSCDVYDAGAPCQTYSVAGHKLGRCGRGELMFEQLAYLRHHQPKLGVFEQVPNFAVLDGGSYLAAFKSQLAELGYESVHSVLEARHFDSCQHRERLIIIAIRCDVQAELGTFVMPSPVTATRPASTVLAPLFKYEGKRFPASDFTACTPIHYDSGLIKVGSVAPHARGSTVWSSAGLLPTQRCSGQGPAGSTGLVLREGVVTEVTPQESAMAQQLPDRLFFDHDLSQVQVGNAIPMGIAFHLGKTIGDYLRPLHHHGVRLLALTPPTPAQVAILCTDSDSTQLPLTAATPLPPACSTIDELTTPHCWWARPQCRQRGCVCNHLALLRLSGFSRHAVLRLEARFWKRLQRRALQRALDLLRHEHKATERDCRLWRADGLAVIANSFDGVGSDAAFVASNAVSLLWWNWRRHLWPVLRDGQQLPLLSQPLRCFKRNAPSANHPNVDKEFERLISLGYLQGPYPEGSAQVHCVNGVLGVPKKDSPDKPRMCVNMTGSGVNEKLQALKFLYPSFDDCTDLCYPGAWLAKVDLTDGFFHRLVRPSDRKYLGLRIPATGELYRYKVFPFGLSVSPHYFSAAISEAHRLLRQHPLFKGAPVLNLPTQPDFDPAKPVVYQVTVHGQPTCSVAIYVDDAMISAPSYKACKAAIMAISKVFIQLGLREKRSKRELPARRCTFLGIDVDTSNGQVTVRVPEARLAQINTSIDNIVNAADGCGEVNRRQLASLVGLLCFFSRAIPASRAFLRRLYGCIHTGVPDYRNYDQDVLLTTEAIADLRWWQDAIPYFRRARVIRGLGTVSVRQHTDASSGGWGCTIEQYQSATVGYSFGLFTRQVSEQSSNFRELLTVYQGLRECRRRYPQAAHIHVVAYTDNSVSASCVNTATSHSDDLLPLAKEIGLFLVENNISCKAVWIPGRQLIKQGADPLSRGAFALEHLAAGLREEFDPYHASHTLAPSFLQRLVGQQFQQLLPVHQPSEWCHEQLEGRQLLLVPAPSATRSCLLHYFDAHRRQSCTTSAVALLPCVSSSEWFRLLRYFGDYVIVRYDEQGRKLIFPVAVAHSPVMGAHSADDQAWLATKALLLPLQAEPTPLGVDEFSV